MSNPSRTLCCEYPIVIQEQRWPSGKSSWLAEQEDRGSDSPPRHLEFSEIGYLLLPSRDMAERSLNRR